MTKYSLRVSSLQPAQSLLVMLKQLVDVGRRLEVDEAKLQQGQIGAKRRMLLEGGNESLDLAIGVTI